MISGNAGVTVEAGGRKASTRPDALSKAAANAFLRVGKSQKDDENADDSGTLFDQRRINEIFVRLKVAEISSCYFAILGI
jgi:hypothetical protein